MSPQPLAKSRINWSSQAHTHTRMHVTSPKTAPSKLEALNNIIKPGGALVNW